MKQKKSQAGEHLGFFFATQLQGSPDYHYFIFAMNYLWVMSFYLWVHSYFRKISYTSCGSCGHHRKEQRVQLPAMHL